MLALCGLDSQHDILTLARSVWVGVLSLLCSVHVHFELSSLLVHRMSSGRVAVCFLHVPIQAYSAVSAECPLIMHVLLPHESHCIARLSFKCARRAALE